MIPILKSAQVREMDRKAIEEYGVPSLDLMEAAGRGAFEYFERMVPELKRKKVLILCGKGNNGGDGFTLAHYLRREWIQTEVVSLAPIKDMTPDTASMARRFKKEKGVIRTCRTRDALEDHLDQADIVVDALLGTGLRQAVREPYRDWINCLNESNKPVLALDMPSGLSADSGKPLGVAVKADWTATMGFMKLGLVMPPGMSYAGDVAVIDIGIPAKLAMQAKTPYRLVDQDSVLGSFRARDAEGHKGRYGHVLVVAGSSNKIGAALMTSKACLRSGAGLTTLCLPKKAFKHVPQQFLEVMYEPVTATEDGKFASSAAKKLSDLWKDKSVIALGPGMGVGTGTRHIVRHVLEKSPLPIVLDADGLNNLVGQMSRLRRSQAKIVLTPHPGEMARLMEVTTQTIQNNRLKFALELATTYQVTVVLKGARSITATPDGKAYINPTGGPAMATAGMGDALTGMIAAFLAQGVTWLQAITSAVYIHGLAGDRLADRMGDRGVLAGDLIDSIPFIIKDFVPRRHSLSIVGK